MQEKNLYMTIANSHPSLKEGVVKCQKCGKRLKVDSVYCLQFGWPKCCGYTMKLINEEGSNECRL